MKSLGLEVTGLGKNAEVWYVGSGEQTEDQNEEASLSTKATEPSSGEVEKGEVRQ